MTDYERKQVSLDNKGVPYSVFPVVIHGRKRMAISASAETYWTYSDDTDLPPGSQTGVCWPEDEWKRGLRDGTITSAETQSTPVGASDAAGDRAAILGILKERGIPYIDTESETLDGGVTHVDLGAPVRLTFDAGGRLLSITYHAH